jgi:hypothetical protein
VETLVNNNNNDDVCSYASVVASISPWRPRYMPELAHVGFVVEKSSTGTGFSVTSSVFPC